jgi:Rrf2 family protein
MRIPARTDYALRSVVALAAAGDAYMKAGELAASEEIPLEFLQNILRDLRRAGLLESQRGYDGGYRLARPAAGITVSDVLEAVGSPLTEPYGRVGSVWDELETSTRGLLGSTTIADLAPA